MKKYIPILTILVILSSCTSEFDGQFTRVREKLGGKTIFHATTEATSTPETKTYADQSMRVVWNEGDQVTIFNKITYNHGFEFNGDDGDTAGDFVQFTPEPSGFSTWEDIEHYYAVYPYTTGNKCDYDGKLTVLLPSVQSYKEDSFGIGANTMVAVSDSTRLQFKNVGGYLSLRLYGDGVRVSSVKIEGNAGEKISGKAFVTIPMGGTPSTVMDETATESITIVCDPAVQLGADAEHYTDFWFVIPPVTFSEGFRITVTDDQGGVFEKTTTNSLTVTRNQLDWMNPLEVTPQQSGILPEDFPDENFRAFVFDNFDTNCDGEISYSEALTVTSIDCGGKSIQSLSGIEFFANLTSLDCSSTLLTSLDVSHNTALKDLECWGIGLTSLDVSNCTELKVLNCSTNWLTSLDVSNNAALQFLDCYSNQLICLDVSHNTALEHLNCHDNQLTNLDISNQTALRELVCYSNQLTSLDVSNNTSLTNLICDDNRLSNLDVSQNTALSQLICGTNQLTNLDVSQNTALTNLWCHSNQITELDVSQNTALTNLKCSDNQLTCLDVSNNLALTSLDCTENPLATLYLKTGQTIATLSKPDETVIKYKDSSGSEVVTIPDASFKAYCVEYFDSNGDGEISVDEAGHITDIYYTSSYIYSLQGIEYMPNLINLSVTAGGQVDLSDSPSLLSVAIMGEAAEEILFSPNASTTLTSLLIHGTNITSLNLSGFTALSNLDIDYSPLQSLDITGCSSLTHLSCHNTQLTSLNLAGLGTMYDLDCSNNELTSLNLAGSGYIDILDCSNNELTSLDLTGLCVGRFNCEYNQMTSLDLSVILAFNSFYCGNNPNLSTIWVKREQSINNLYYDTDIATIMYKN